MEYGIEEHKHRYAAWAASRAASTITCRFNVLQGKKILENIGLSRFEGNPDRLPTPEKIDESHREWRVIAMQSAHSMSLIGFGDGIAAKLINVYLKGTFVCAGHAFHPNVAALHPPIDSLLLKSLLDGNKGDTEVWKKAHKARWSKFDSAQYEEVIAAIRLLQAGKPLWQVEEHWRGYQ